MAIKVVEGKDYKILPDDYRAEFHKHNKPARIEKKIVNGQVIPVRMYRCMYCGKLVPHTEMQVDHIIPKTRLYAGILWNPNKSWNLGPSCPKCNISKSNYIDSRVIKGFQNKLLNKYGLTRKLADFNGKDIDIEEETTSGDSENLQKIIPFVMVLVYALTILKPFILLAAWIIQAALFVLTRVGAFLWKTGKKLFRWSIKKLRKTITYYATHPHKIYKLAGKIAIAALVLYGLGFAAGGFDIILLKISEIGGVIWGYGSGFFKNLFT